jgi:hypothetical protein
MYGFRVPSGRDIGRNDTLIKNPRPVGTKLLWFVPLPIFRPYGTYLLV